MDSIQEFTPEELQNLMGKENSIVIIDVREVEEVAQGMIEDAKHIPLQEIPNSIDELSKDKHYVLVCRSGARSMRAATYLDEQGFKVSNLAGGMLDWDGEVVY
ncbi:rhodanese-like domain-containing protein [Virgibacillus phasianinus]|uniref:Rhodanese-like domain-containing protein n=1 Tax=Virgibacillus phasianinus TaxID=2017483 RepID=A0A220U416_9BACI|nr:rhodanese-like domain-containing protein [Virgibacillus phasianinus]ASK62908.1 rhodanese-like domain-containing protein [Virgibacillus phasianinus]